MGTSSLGQTIRLAREKKGWTRAQLARECHVPYTTIRNIENADHDVRTDEVNLEAIALALGNITFDELRVLAGYIITKSIDIDAANRRLLAQIDAHPQLKKSLQSLLNRGDMDEIDRALTVLEVHTEVERRNHRRRPKGQR